MFTSIRKHHKIRKILTAPLLPFAILFIFLLVIHFLIPLGTGDDLYYASIIPQTSLWNFSVQHYRTWSARTLVELAFCYFNYIPTIVWRILNPTIAVICALALSYIISAWRDARTNWVLCALFLVIPWATLSSAGWITTTIAYLWTGTAALVAFVPICSLLRNQKAHIIMCIASLPLLLFAANMEQVAVWALPALIAALGFYIYTYKKVHWLLIVQPLLCIGNLVYALASPGTKARFEVEVTSGFVDFGTRSLFQNLELGLSATLNPVIYGQDYIFDIFCLLLAIVIWIRYKNIGYRILGALPVVISFTFSYAMRLFPSLAFFTEALGKNGLLYPTNVHHFSAYLPYLVLYCTLALCVINLYLALGHTHISFFAIVALGCGLLSRVMLGFSPTIWTSGTRTGFFFTITLVGLCALLFKQISTIKNWMKLPFHCMLLLTLSIQTYRLLASIL